MNIEHYHSLMRLFDSWLNGERLFGAIIISVMMASLRIAYFNGSWKKILLEAILCGLLTLTITSAFEYFNFKKSLAITVGGSIGLIGVGTIREIVMRLIQKKMNTTDK
ncbi:phage holin, lambda family [Enterobacter cancerogenus]|uniref:phage holin, lambda family n=1 Tax=Enterobacter cancerogenus TaxID=69218 RepID=UPI00235E03A1|nr:phage holin, lambda family [Enterobacter cancerogenus]